MELRRAPTMLRMSRARSPMKEEVRSESPDADVVVDATIRYRDLCEDTENTILKESRHNPTLVVEPYKDESVPSFRRIVITGEDTSASEEAGEVAQMMIQAVELRKKYIFIRSDPYKYTENSKGVHHPSRYEPAGTSVTLKCDKGVYKCEWYGEGGVEPASCMPDQAEYYTDLRMLMECVGYGSCKTFCYRRLQLLESKFNLHLLLNESLEREVQRSVPHRDFYNVRKVDTHVHHSAAMNEKHLLKFIKRKLRERPNETVIERNGVRLTLKEVFESLKLSPYHLSINMLDMHADTNTFHRFDRFNLKYNPLGQSRLREIFLKTDNFVKGRYLAELTRELIQHLESTKYIMAEWRISIYGRNKAEWTKLAAWVMDNDLCSDNVRWMIQIPRLYALYRSQEDGGMTNFGQFLSNVFQPLFDVTLNPDSNPVLHEFLFQISGFDSVDDESRAEKTQQSYPDPMEWESLQNPPYSYYNYYIAANIHSLNRLRERRGMNSFLFRPHAGEAGEYDHLASSFLLADGINHGILLRKIPVLQYLFYLTQIGLAMSPVGNNALFLTYERNPFPSFFARGLNVSLSTDDPLQFHMSREPLIEEYTIAQQTWKLSSCDLCELARNSVYQSGFESETRHAWLGPNCDMPGTLGNDVNLSSVPNVRVRYRQEALVSEIESIRRLAVATNEANDVSVIDELLDKYGGPVSIPVCTL